jgi:hypothetical protein
MNNYLKKYSNYFLVLGVLLLAMYFLDVVPYRLRNAPASLRLFGPIIFIIVGFIGKFLENEKSNNPQTIQNMNEQMNYQNQSIFEKDIFHETNQFYSNQETNREVKNLTPNEWFKQNPGKSLNDYYMWRNRN